jgi:hypothetical protein
MYPSAPTADDSARALRVLRTAGRLAVTVLGAAIIGFGIPGGWLLVGGLIQSGSEGGGVVFTAIAVIFCGIIASYFLLIYAVGLVAARRMPTSRPRRYNWNRSMRDARHSAPKLNLLESVFVTTAITVGMAYMIWFFFFAEASLPGG